MGHHPCSLSLIFNLFLSLTFSLLSTFALAFDVPQMKVGSGSLFEMKLASGNAQMAIVVVDRNSQELGLEFYFKDLSAVGIEMWQRFQVRPQGKKLNLSQGYVLMPQLGDPFILSDEYLKGFDGAQISSFMLESENEFQEYKIDVEKITVPAGTIEATHYRMTERSQTIDYWVHESAKPVGIVKMTSKGKSIKENYSLELKTLLSNAAPKINIKKARPLTPEAKKFLPQLGTPLLLD